MSVKHPKIRIALKVIVLLMFGAVIYNSVQDYKECEASLRRESYLEKIKQMVKINEREITIVKR